MLLAAGLVALAGILTGVLIGMQARSAAARKDREERAVRNYLNQFRDHLPEDRVPVPPDVIVIFSSVQEDLSRIGTELTAAQAEKRGQDIAAMAKESADGLEAVSVGGLIPQEFSEDRAALNEAQFLIVQSYRLYEQIGGLIEAAATSSAKQQTAIVDQVQLLMNRSGSLFDRGYVRIVRLAKRLGIPVETAFQPPPAVPQPTASPNPAPTATATPGSSPSPSPSA